MNTVIFIIVVVFGIYIYLRFTKKGKQMHLFQTPQELLLTIHSEINEELKVFIENHDFSIYTPNVGVFGENSTGKSTFLNAMLGNKDEFKMGFGETTDKVTVLYKNDKPIPKGKSCFVQVDSNMKYIKKSYKYLNYMNLFDIPGFGQKFSHKELNKVIKEIDIVFWFLDVSKGVKKDDKVFLENIKNLDTKVIVVLNKIDAISENEELEKVLKEIKNEIAKIKTFFIEENVLVNLVTIFPFSATKSLVGTVKGEKGAFRVIDKIIENILLYTVFIESYRGYIQDIDKDNFTMYEYEYEYSILKIISDAAEDLEIELKENISFGSSLNPFSSKDEEAELIILSYLDRVEIEVNNYNNDFSDEIKSQMLDYFEVVNAFKVFGKVELPEFNQEELEYLDIDMDLNSMAWNSFFGDSFAEEVASKFKKKITKKVKRQIVKILNKCSSNINLYKEELQNDANEFAISLDKKLYRTTQKIQEPLLTLLLKALKKELNEQDQKYIEKMLKL